MLPILPKTSKQTVKIINAFGGIDRTENAKENCFYDMLGADNTGGEVIETAGSFGKVTGLSAITGKDAVVLKNGEGEADVYCLGRDGFYKNGTLLPFYFKSEYFSGNDGWAEQFFGNIKPSTFGACGDMENTKLVCYGKYIFAFPQMIYTDGEYTRFTDGSIAICYGSTFLSFRDSQLSVTTSESVRKRQFGAFRSGDEIELCVYNHGNEEGRVLPGKFVVAKNEDGEFSVLCKTESGTAAIASSIDFGAFSVNRYFIRHKDHPVFTDAVIAYNRLWGVSGNRIYASKLGHPFAFKETDGTPSDCWWADTEDSDTFTALAGLSGRVVAFKEHSAYEIYGTVQPYTIKDVSRSLGCVDRRSLKEVNGVLFLLTHEGMCVYGGSKFINVNEPLGGVPSSVISESYGSKYFGLMDSDLYKYNYYTGYWTKICNIPFKNLIKFSGEIFGIDSSGGLVQITGSPLACFTYAPPEAVNWSMESVSIGGGDFTAEGINRAELRLEGLTCGVLKTEVARDGGAFETYAVTNIKEGWQIFTVPIFMKPCSVFRIRLSGNGKLRLKAIKYVIRKGGSADEYE